MNNHLLFLFSYIVEPRIRANTQKRTTRGAGDKRGGRGNSGERRTEQDKTVGNRDMRRSVDGRGMGWGTQGKQDGHDRDFQEGKQGI